MRKTKLREVQVPERQGYTELKDTELYPSFVTEGLEEVAPRSYAALQHRALKAVRTLLVSPVHRMLCICASRDTDALSDMEEIAHRVAPALKVRLSRAPTRRELFGTDGLKDKAQPLSSAPLVADTELLILPAALFLEHPRYVSLMQRAMESHHALKLILCADAGEASQLPLFWPETDLALHTDFVSEFPALGGMELMAGLLESFRHRLNLKPFSPEAVRLFAIWSCRQSGDRRWMGLPRLRLESLAAEASSYARGERVTLRDALKALAAEDFRLNFLAEAELRDHRDRQLLIATKGAVTGQINGLSVIEMSASAYEFGEPVRITATLRAGGEGDIIDIERKAELAGQIHAKAMMIINGYITREFGAEAPLPVSASLVFEQSYSEIDGDSASLTGLCAVISCLAGIPVRQDLAVTGAVDQFGDVQPVGGVNEKIEGFFRVCRLHGLTGTQGVIIPASCVQQLVLRPAVVRAVKAGRFHIYTVNHVTEAVKLLTTVDWGDASREGSVVNRIVNRLYEVAAGRDATPWWKFWVRQ